MQARLALTWLDEYKEFFFHVNPRAREAAADQNVTARLELRHKLKVCNAHAVRGRIGSSVQCTAAVS